MVNITKIIETSEAKTIKGINSELKNELEKKKKILENILNQKEFYRNAKNIETINEILGINITYKEINKIQQLGVHKIERKIIKLKLNGQQLKPNELIEMIIYELNNINAHIELINTTDYQNPRELPTEALSTFYKINVKTIVQRNSFITDFIKTHKNNGNLSNNKRNELKSLLEELSNSNGKKIAKEQIKILLNNYNVTDFIRSVIDKIFTEINTK